MIKNDQQTMDQEMRAAVEEVYEKQAGRVNDLMRPKFVGCSDEDRTVTIAFPVLEWELNRVGFMHGGIIGAAFDCTLGILTRYYSRLNFSPTIGLETTFIKPIPSEDEFLITGRIVSAGRTITHLYAEAYLKSTGVLMATATASYLNFDIKK